MLSYSFYTTDKDYPNSKQEARTLLETTDKKIKYTYGFKYRGPTTYEVLITNEDAVKRFNESSLSDVVEHEDWIDFNQYSSNDLL